MYSALLRPHRMLGLLLSPTSVRFARATGSARSGSVQDHGAADIPKAPELLDPASIDTALQSLASSVTTGSAVSVCLPPQAVYYAVAPTNAASVSATLDTLIPEPPDSLAVQTAPLKKHAGDRTSVIALRSDLLKHTASLAQKHGLRLARVTTISCALAPSLGHERTMLIVSVEGQLPTMTLVERGRPIDELVLPSETKDGDIVTECTSLLAEWSQSSPIPHIAVVGPTTLAEQIKQSLAPEQPKKKSRSKRDADAGEKKEDSVMPQPQYTITSLFSWVEKRQQPDLGAIIAAVQWRHALDLRPAPRHVRRWLLGLLVLTLLGGVASLWFLRPDLVPFA